MRVQRHVRLASHYDHQDKAGSANAKWNAKRRSIKRRSITGVGQGLFLKEGTVMEGTGRLAWPHAGTSYFRPSTQSRSRLVEADRPVL